MSYRCLLMASTTIQMELNLSVKAILVVTKLVSLFVFRNTMDIQKRSNHTHHCFLLRPSSGKRVHLFSVDGHKTIDIIADRPVTGTRLRVPSMLDLCWIAGLLRSLRRLPWETKSHVRLQHCEDLHWTYRQPMPLRWVDEQDHSADHDRARISTAQQAKGHIRLLKPQIMEGTILPSQVLI